MINKRQEDLSKVFDRTWSANHNDVAKRGREKEKQFINKLFGNKPNNNEVLTPGQKAENLHNNMHNSFIGQRQNQINNIVKKWK